MYIHPIQHKGKVEKVTLLQLNGWALESHCWLDEGGWPRTCQWCGQVAKKDMDPDAMNLCSGNPFVIAALEEQKQQIYSDIGGPVAGVIPKNENGS